MELGKRKIWQLAGGDWGRWYADIFLRYGVGLIGEGDAGSWSPERQDKEFGGGFVRWFADQVAEGDVFLLRMGTSRIRAIGIVASEYMYLSQFDDVNGWDLQHGRRVRWFQLPREQEFNRPVFGANPRRFSRTYDKEVVEYAKRFLGSPPTDWQTAPLPELPEEEPAMPDEEIPVRLQEIVGEVRDLHRLFWDRAMFGERPTEDELVAHFVVPLVRALGWPPEQIGVKWRNVDLVIFDRLPRAPENCRLIIEAKRLGTGVEGALKQAKNYLTALGVQRDVIVTDGVRYRMYACEKEFESVAYANLSRLKQKAMELFSRIERRSP